MSPESTVLIHGDKWQRTDIENEIAVCRTRSWRRERWRPRPALIHRIGGGTSLFHGQTFDPTKTDLVPNGWNHDHCAICWWTLIESDDEQRAFGYIDEIGEWICSECYSQFIETNLNELANGY